MEIYYVNRESQGPEMETPQLINGEHKTWVTERMAHRGDNFNYFDKNSPEWSCTLQGWIEEVKIKRPYVKTIFIHNVESIEGLFCDQSCKPNQPGCREKYILNNFMLVITAAFEIDEVAREEFNKNRGKITGV